MRWAAQMECMGERCAHRVLVGTPEGKKPPGRPWVRRKDNIKINFQVVEWGGIDRIDLAEDRSRCRVLANAVMSLRVA